MPQVLHYDCRCLPKSISQLTEELGSSDNRGSFVGQDHPSGFYYRPKRNSDKIVWRLLSICQTVGLSPVRSRDLGFPLISWRRFVPEEYSSLRRLIIGLFHMIILQKRMCVLSMWPKQVHDRFVYRKNQVLVSIGQNQSEKRSRLTTGCFWLWVHIF